RSPHVVGVELVPGLGGDDRIPVGVEQRFAFSVLRREVDLPEVLTGFRVDDRVAVLVGEVHRREFPLLKLSGFQLVRRGPPSVDGLTRAVVVDVEVLARFRVDHRVAVAVQNLLAVRRLGRRVTVARVRLVGVGIGVGIAVGIGVGVVADTRPGAAAGAGPATSAGPATTGSAASAGPASGSAASAGLIAGGIPGVVVAGRLVRVVVGVVLGRLVGVVAALTVAVAGRLIGAIAATTAGV